MTNSFYRAFEDRYRGSRELIKSRLLAYLPFVEPLLTIYPAASAVDLGCGRGEWLEVLTSAGFTPRGVDLDAGMLAACTELGLDVVQGDALAYLDGVADESVAVFSAFHMVEHIGFEELCVLVEQAKRVLKPGGVLIMETPNPENIVVATRYFYNDPTHQRPIPPTLLSFVPEYCGFSRTKVVRLQESPALRQKQPSLHEVLEGASPDYAVVAQKGGSQPLAEALDPCFATDFGLTLDALASRYDKRIDMSIEQAEVRVRQAEERAQHETGRAELAEARAQQESLRAAERVACEVARAEQAEARARQDVAHAAERVTQEMARAEQAEARARQDVAHAAERLALETARAGQAEARVEHECLRAARAEQRAEHEFSRADRAEHHVQQVETHLRELQQVFQTQTLTLQAVQVRSGELGCELAEVATNNHHHKLLADARAEELAALAGHMAETQRSLAESQAACAESRAQVAQKAAEIEYWHGRVLQLHASTSWRITKPLRAVKRLLAGQWNVSHAASATEAPLVLRCKHAVRAVLAEKIRYVFARPRLRQGLSRVLKRAPWLHRRLFRVAVNTGVVDMSMNASPKQVVAVNQTLEPQAPCAIPDAEAMSPRARAIYADLKQAMADRARERH